MSDRIITAAELSPGLFVTVLDPAEKDAPAYEQTHQVVVVGGNGQLADDIERYRGTVLRVMAVDLPFVAFETLSERPWVLDSRKFKFMELKEEFVAAVRGSVNHYNTNGEPIDVRAMARNHDNLCTALGRDFAVINNRLAALETAAPAPVAAPHSRKRAAIQWLLVHWVGVMLAILGLGMCIVAHWKNSP